MEYASALPSRSDPERVTARGVFSGVLTLCALAMGASFTALMVMAIVAGDEFNEPSFTRNVKLSGPL